MAKRPAKKKKNNKKIIRYRRPLNINVGMIIFALIFVYMSFSVYTYLKRDKIQFYEVTEGGIVNNQIHTGIAIREETTKYAASAGYVNYYIREGKRASVGTRIYSIDQMGSISARLAQNAQNAQDGSVNLTKENVRDLKKQLTSFCLNYEDDDFSTVYDVKYSLDASVLEYMNFNALDQLDALAGEEGTSFVQVRADQAGVISYAVDSYEDLDASGVSAAVFDKSQYNRQITKSGQLLDSGDAVYKVITSDRWSLIFPMTEEDVKALGDKTSVKVSFKGRDLKADASFSMITGTDALPYGKLDFDKYMVQFEEERYLDFEILLDQAEGLKIPVSAATDKNFYLVPAEYMTQGGDSTEDGFQKEVYSETGTSVVFVPTTIYYSKDGYYYIDTEDEDGLKAGDYIVKPDSTDRYQIGTTNSLQGVYNINKGYAVFKQIEVLSSNEEYYTVKKNMPYGLSVFDHIVLDASKVKEGDLIYQ